MKPFIKFCSMVSVFITEYVNVTIQYKKRVGLYSTIPLQANKVLVIYCE